MKIYAEIVKAWKYIIDSAWAYTALRFHVQTHSVEWKCNVYSNYV